MERQDPVARYAVGTVVRVRGSGELAMVSSSRLSGGEWQYEVFLGSEGVATYPERSLSMRRIDGHCPSRMMRLVEVPPCP